MTLDRPEAADAAQILGVGWLPWLVEELEYRHWRVWECAEYWESHGGIEIKTKPSDLFKRQIYATFQGESDGDGVAQF
jgi:hypothetical protein